MFEFPPEPGPLELPLTAERLSWQLDVLEWSRQELARRTEVSSTKAQKWVTGQSFMPNRIAIWLEHLAQVMLAIGKPMLWTRDPRMAAAKHPWLIEAMEHAWDPRALLERAGAE
jgi:hypothetical protein